MLLPIVVPWDRKPRWMIMNALTSYGTIGDWRFLGEALRYMRRENAVTQAEVATALGVDRKTITNYEGGRVPASAPRVPDGYYAVAEHYGLRRTDVDTLLKGPYKAFAIYAKETLDAGEDQNMFPDAERLLARWVFELAPPELRLKFLEERMATDAGMPVDLPDVPAPGATPAVDPSLQDAIDLFAEANRFAQICEHLGASASTSEEFRETARELLREASLETLQKAGLRLEELERKTAPGGTKTEDTEPEASRE